MSIGELIVVILVAALIIKVEDIAVIIKYIISLRKKINKFQSEIISYFVEDTQIDETLQKQATKINFYLKTIIEIEGSYDGEYTSEAIEEKYNKLTRNNIKLNENINSTN